MSYQVFEQTGEGSGVLAVHEQLADAVTDLIAMAETYGKPLTITTEPRRKRPMVLVDKARGAEYVAWIQEVGDAGAV